MKILKTAALQALCGAVAGAAVAAILAAIAIPSYTKIALPLAVAEEFARAGRFANSLSAFSGLAYALMGMLVVAASWIMTARSLNPNLACFPFLKNEKPLLAWVVVFIAGLAAWAPQAGLPGATGILFVSMGGGQSTPWLEYALLGAFGGALAWLVISPAGWAGGFTEWRAPWTAALATRPRTIALGALYGGIVGGAGQAAGRVFGFLFLANIELWHPSGELRMDVIGTNFAILICLLAACFVSAWSLAWALADDEADGLVRLCRGIPAIAAGGLVFVVALAVRADAIDHHDWHAGSLVRAANLPDSSTQPMTVVTLGFDKKPFLDAQPQMAAHGGMMTDSGAVPATAANAAAIETFLNGSGAKSRFRDGALDALGKVYGGLWRPPAAFQSYVELSPRYTTPILVSVMERAWFAFAAPVTPENRRRLELLSDTKVYRIPARPALQLARAWARFGELDRSRDWLGKASGAEDAGKFSVPSKPPLTNGVVSGRLSLSRGAIASVTAGLFAVRPSDQGCRALTAPLGVLANLSAAQPLKADGAFKFENLAEGRYCLSLLAPSSLIPPDLKAVSASKNPAVITVDRAHPRVDVGAISLKVP